MRKWMSLSLIFVLSAIAGLGQATAQSSGVAPGSVRPLYCGGPSLKSSQPSSRVAHVNTGRAAQAPVAIDADDGSAAQGPGNWVVLPAGSVNGLQAAILEAGRRGTVLVEAGLHTEDGPVFIEESLTLLGEPGAVVASVTTPYGDLPLLVEGALHVRNTRNVTIHGLELVPLGGGPSNTAIVIENSPHVTLSSNYIHDYTVGIQVQRGDHARITENRIDLLGTDDGIRVINGRHIQITGNTVSNAFFGIWATDRNGRIASNVTSDSVIGVILCKVPALLELEGALIGSAESAIQWHAMNNLAERNFWGYAVTDGSSDNLLVNNAAADNVVDIEVLGDSLFFGFLTPTATNTTIVTGAQQGIGVHDCGVNTQVMGDATLIDLPCF